MLDLTFLERVKQLVKYKESKTGADFEIKQIITGVSASVARYLNRYDHMLTVARTEVYDLDALQARLQLSGYPISSTPAPVLKNDINSDFSAADALSTDSYYIKERVGMVKFRSFVPSWGPGVLQIVYTGGLGETAFKLIGVPSTEGGTPAAAQKVIGQTSGARGILRAYTTDTTYSIDVLSGIFVAGEVVNDEATPANLFTLSTITSTPICMNFPEITHAAEWQISYLWKRKDTQGLVSVSAEGGSISLEQPTVELLKGVRSKLRRYRKAPGKGPS